MATPSCVQLQLNLESYLKQLGKPDRVAEALATYRAGLLGAVSPLSHSVLGKFGQRVMEHGMVAPVRALTDQIYQQATGQKTYSWAPPSMDDVKAAAAEAAKVWRGEKSGVTADAFHPAWGPTTIEQKVLQPYTNAMMKPYETETEFFKTLEFNSSVKSQAMTIARNEGLKGNDFLSRVNQLISDAMSDHLNPIAINARASAEWATNMNDNPISQGLSDFQGKLRRGQMVAAEQGNKVGAASYAAGRVALGAVAPFTRVPVNAALRTAVDYSLAGAAKGIAMFFTDKEKGPAMDAFSRGITGSGLMMLGAWLYAHDRMTPTSTGQQGKQQRADAVESGRPAGAIQIPGTGNWVETALTKMPWLAMMQQGADLWHAVSGGDTSVLHAGTRMLSADVAQSPLQEGASAVDALSQEGADTGAAKRFVGGKIGSLVPGPIATAAQMVDPNQHDISQSLLAGAQSRIPFASQTLPNRLGSFGTTATRPGLLNPEGMTQENADPLYSALRAIGVTVGLPSKAGGSLKSQDRYSLSPDDYQQFIKQYGPVLEARLRAYLTGIVKPAPGASADEQHTLAEWAQQHSIDAGIPNFTRDDWAQMVKQNLIEATAREWKQSNTAILRRNAVVNKNQADRAMSGLR